MQLARLPLTAGLTGVTTLTLAGVLLLLDIPAQ